MVCFLVIEVIDIWPNLHSTAWIVVDVNDILLTLPQVRRVALEDAVRLFKFYRECDEFEAWMKEKVCSISIFMSPALSRVTHS